MPKINKIENDPDNPIWTKRDFGRAMHFPKGATLAEAAEALRKARGRQKAPKKMAISIRLEPEIAEHFKKDGAGWQKRMETALAKVVGK